MPADIISSTTQQFLDIHDITNNFVIMKDGTVSVILTVDAMNFGLLAEEEQDAIMYAYAGLLNSLNYPIQIIIHSQTKDVTVYLQLLKDQEDQAASDTMRRRIRQYREFVGNLIHERNVLDKKFYVTIPATALELGIAGASSVLPGQNKFDVSQIERSVLLEKAQNLLDPKRDHLISQFARIGLFSRQLATQEIIQLFYVRYNPEAIEGQQIAESRSYTAPLVQASIQESFMNENTANLPPSPVNTNGVTPPTPDVASAVATPDTVATPDAASAVGVADVPTSPVADNQENARPVVGGGAVETSSTDQNLTATNDSSPLTNSETPSAATTIGEAALENQGGGPVSSASSMSRSQPTELTTAPVPDSPATTSPANASATPGISTESLGSTEEAVVTQPSAAQSPATQPPTPQSQEGLVAESEVPASNPLDSPTNPESGGEMSMPSAPDSSNLNPTPLVNEPSASTDVTDASQSLASKGLPPDAPAVNDSPSGQNLPNEATNMGGASMIDGQKNPSADSVSAQSELNEVIGSLGAEPVVENPASVVGKSTPSATPPTEIMPNTPGGYAGDQSSKPGGGLDNAPAGETGIRPQNESSSIPMSDSISSPNNSPTSNSGASSSTEGVMGQPAEPTSTSAEAASPSRETSTLTPTQAPAETNAVQPDKDGLPPLQPLPEI